MRTHKILTSLAALAVAATAVIVPLAVSSSAATAPLLGSYNGAANPAGGVAFATETGTTPSIYSDYLDGTSWGSMVGSSGSPSWVISRLKGQLGSQRLLLSVPLVHAGYSSDQAALAAYAANPATWDANFTTLARNLVADGFSNAIIRLMWEPDAGIYSSDDLTSAANYAALWRDAHSAMAAVSGSNFQWAWYWGANFDATTNNTAYPGSAYVDYITFDDYDQSWDTSCGVPYNGSNFTQAQHQCLWKDDQDKGLVALTAFAKAQGKPIGIGEWGVIDRSDGHGGGDDPYWVNDFTAWMKANNVAWASYFNFNSGGNSILADYPNSLAAYRADLGGGSTPATTTTTTQASGTSSPPVTTTTTTTPKSTTTTTTAPPSGVVVTRVSPNTGPTSGGTTVTVTGSGFSGATAVNFGTIAATIKSVSATVITVTAPASGGGTTDVTVTTPAGRSQATVADQFTYVYPLPSITSVSPSAGTSGGGASVTITGNGFTGATRVSFGSAAASFTVNSNTSITATAPAGVAASVVDVSVAGPGGTSAVVAADKFSYGPVITSVNPRSGNHLGGTTVTINGVGFAGASAVSFGGTLVTSGITVNAGGTQITVAAPANAAGTVDITVTVGGVTTQTSTLDQFTYA